MIKEIAFIILIATCNNQLYANKGIVAKGSFAGVVTDIKTGKPVTNVTIYITDIKVGTSTDTLGLFRFNNIPEGKHLVEISHIGYVTLTDEIIINGQLEKNYSLKESVVENDAVVVTGVTGATQMKKVPFSVSVFKKQALFQSASITIMDALTKEPGVTTVGTGPAISKPVIRGLSSNRVLTVHDGVRQEGQQWGDEHGIEIDEASVQKVEILKGPASLIYGSDAMAGVINIITCAPVQENTLKAEVSSNYQSNNQLRSFNAQVGGNSKGFNWNMYSSNKGAADYKNKYDGYVFNSKFLENNIGGHIGYNGNWGYSHLLISQFNLRAGVIEGERDTAGNFIRPIGAGLKAPATRADFYLRKPFIPYQHITHFKVAIDNSIKTGASRITWNMGLQQNKRREYGNINSPNEESLFFDLSTFTYTAQYHISEKNSWKPSIGISGMVQKNSNRGVEQLIPNYNLADFGAYVYGQKRIKKMALSGGLRVDTRTLIATNLLDGSIIKGVGFKRSFSNISGSVGMAWEATEKLNIKVNMARGYRAPSIPELASNGSHEGTNRYEYGFTGLKNETSLQLDAGLDYTTDHISISLSPYFNRITNFIFYGKLVSTGGGDSLVQVQGDLIPAFKFSQRPAILMGTEIKLDIHPHPIDWLHIENSFSLIRGTFVTPIDGSKNLPLMPAPRLSTELRGNFTQHNKTLHDYYIYTELEHHFLQKNVFSAFNTETITAAYSLLHVGIGATIINSKKQPLLNIAISLNNVTNTTYQNHLSRLKYAAENMATGRVGVFNMGRNFSIKLNIPLSFTLTR